MTERHKLNGNVSVIESLLGSLQPGASLHIRELASFKSEKSRQKKCMDDGLSLGDCPKNDGKAKSNTIDRFGRAGFDIA
ncbi:MAG: hypothetical protein ACREAC_08640 [Blastocatellia bacterium]